MNLPGKTPTLSKMVFSAFALSLLCSCSKSTEDQPQESKLQSLDFKPGDTGKVVYCIQEVDKDKTIPPEALEESTVEINRIPEHAVSGASRAAGLVARYKILKGQMVDERDVREPGEFGLTLQDDAQKKLCSLAIQEGKSASELASQWIKEKLESATETNSSKKSRKQKP